jgi:uncharacterized membrane protein YphA (DoxX/SURF4 family)
MVDRFLKNLDRLKQIKVFKLFTWFTRILIGIGLFFGGLGKPFGECFAGNIRAESPIKIFFDNLCSIPEYWGFLGISQMIAGIFLVIPKTTTVGAMMAFGIVLNMYLITLFLHFHGTTFITGFMLLGTIYLLIWDAKKLLKLF